MLFDINLKGSLQRCCDLYSGVYVSRAGNVVIDYSCKVSL